VPSRHPLSGSRAVSTIFSPAGTIAAMVFPVHITSVLVDRLGIGFYIFYRTYLLIFARSPSGPFVDQAGVPLTQGGGTLVLGTHGSVRL
jgi:hypothetical protein